MLELSNSNSWAKLMGACVSPNKVMNRRNSMFVALAFILATSVAHAAEVAWLGSSVSGLSIFVTNLRFRIYADHCSAGVPALKPKFDSLMEQLNGRILVISKDLLASEAFRDMKDKPVPAEVIDAFKDSFHDVQHNFERQDAALVCPKTLQDFGAVDDESLKSGLTEALTAVQNMTRKLAAAP